MNFTSFDISDSRLNEIIKSEKTNVKNLTDLFDRYQGLQDFFSGVSDEILFLKNETVKIGRTMESGFEEVSKVIGNLPYLVYAIAFIIAFGLISWAFIKLKKCIKTGKSKKSNHLPLSKQDQKIDEQLLD